MLVELGSVCLGVVGCKENEPSHEKTNNLGFRQGPTQTDLYSHRNMKNFGYK